MSPSADPDHDWLMLGERLLLQADQVKFYYQLDGSIERYSTTGSAFVTDLRLVGRYRTLLAGTVGADIARSTIEDAKLVTWLRMRGAISRAPFGRQIVRFRAERRQDGRGVTIGIALPTAKAGAWLEELSFVRPEDG